MKKLNVSLSLLTMIFSSGASADEITIGENCSEKIQAIGKAEYEDNDEAVGAGECSVDVPVLIDQGQYHQRSKVKVVCSDSGEPDFSESYSWEFELISYKNTNGHLISKCEIQKMEYLSGYSD